MVPFTWLCFIFVPHLSDITGIFFFQPRVEDVSWGAMSGEEKLRRGVGDRGERRDTG